MASMVYLRPRPRSFLRASSPACSSSSRSLLFSSSTSPPDFNDGNPPNTENNQSNTRSSFSDLKSHLRDGETNQQPPRKPFSFSEGARSPPNQLPPRKPFSFSQGARSPPNQPSSIFIDEIRNNLKGFRSNVQAPQSAAPAGQIPSFQEIYRKSFGESRPSDRSSSPLSSMASIKESLRRSNVSEKRETSAFKLPNIKDSLGLRPNAEESNAPGSRVIGGTTEDLPLAVFGEELSENSKKGRNEEDAKINGLMKAYSSQELGEQLRKLRPEGVKKGENWFSFSELNERLIKLREIESKQITQLSSGTFAGLRATLKTVQQSSYEKDRMNSARRADIIGHLSQGTPKYMLTSPKEHLVEKYFHPDNMSAAEKLKLELKRVRDEFKMSDTDCGSTRVQIAQLTTEIHYLSKALHKKDKHSRKGLIAKVQMRKKLLKYLRRTDWDSYCFILSSLGLRDNPGYKQVKQ